MDLNTKDMWDALGSAWDEFQDKPTIEVFWRATASGIDEVDRVAIELQKSRALPYLTTQYNTGPELYKIIYSGLSTDLNVIIGSGISFFYPIDPWTISIPNILSSYKYRGTSYTDTYNENVHYTISGMNYIAWNYSTWPNPDLRFPGKGVLLGYAPIVKRYNPMLMNTWAKMCNFTLTNYVSYSGMAQPSDEHLKYLLWGLWYTLQRPPSIETLEIGFGIARGLPFAYESGTAAVSDRQITLGNYVYTLPSGVTAIPNGTAVTQFDILCSGATLYDYTTNPDLVTSYSTIYSNRNTLVYTLDHTLASIPYSTTFFTDFTERITPEQIQYFIRQE